MHPTLAPRRRSFARAALLAFGLAWLVPGSLLAQTTGDTVSDIKKLGGSLLERSKELVDESIEKSRELGEKAWVTTRELGEKALEGSKEALGSVPGAARPAALDLRAEERIELARVWEDLVERLDAGREQAERIAQAPESSWIGRDKASLREDFVDQLDELVVLLEDGSIFHYRDRVAGIRSAIAERRERIQRWRESRLMAPAEDKPGYDAKIDGAESNIDELEDELERIRRDLRVRLRHVGIELDAEQVSVLLSRVDSDDIIQMAAVFQVLTRITEQLRTLIEESGESIDAARRYYGMHVVLLEAVARMQDRYVELVDTEYVPSVRSIADRTDAIRRETRDALEAETDARRRAVYEKNLAAQALTLEAAGLYQGHLQTQRDKVAKARETIGRDLELAYNTYETVNLSAELFHLLEASQAAYQAVVRLQVPDLVPFENVDLRRKYEELSAEIAKG